MLVLPAQPVQGEVDIAGDPRVVVLVGQVEQVLDQLHVAAVSTWGRRQGVSQQFQSPLGSSAIDRQAVWGGSHQQS